LHLPRLLLMNLVHVKKNEAVYNLEQVCTKLYEQRKG